MGVQSLLIASMIKFHENEPQLVQHFMKVYAFAKTIGELEGLDEKTQYILELAAISHDVGILVSMEKYGSSNFEYQELEGPPVAKQMLKELGADDDIIERVCYLVSRHHTWDGVEGKDYQILLEADFLVNAHEHGFGIDKLEKPFLRLFKTETGKEFFNNMFNYQG